MICSYLTNPDNGMINCSLGDDGVPSHEDTCSFTCNIGYELTGSDTRTCQSDGSWSSSDVTCMEPGTYTTNNRTIAVHYAAITSYRYKSVNIDRRFTRYTITITHHMIAYKVVPMLRQPLVSALGYCVRVR